MLAASARCRQDRDWFGKMSMHLSPFDDLNSGTVAKREPSSRRIGVVLSILFLTSLGTVASLTSAQAGAHEQADAPIAASASPTATAR